MDPWCWFSPISYLYNSFRKCNPHSLLPILKIFLEICMTWNFIQNYSICYHNQLDKTRYATDVVEKIFKSTFYRFPILFYAKYLFFTFHKWHFLFQPIRAKPGNKYLCEDGFTSLDLQILTLTSSFNTF